MRRGFRWLILSAGVLGCVGRERVSEKPHSRDEMVSLLEEALPDGTPLRVAEEEMRRQGFSCQRMEDANFSESLGMIGEGPARSVEDATLLLCERNESAGFLVSRGWSIAIVAEEEMVTDILVKTQLDGP